MRYTTFLLLLFTLIFITCNCKDDDEVIDPCQIEGIMPVNANFQTYYNMDWQDSIRLIAADTFINAGFISFIAEQEDATYQWKVGSDPRVFEEKQFTLSFTNLEGPVNIQLIVEATPNTECFPDDDGRDTLSKNIYFVHPEESPIFGMFRGVNSSAPNDTFNIDVQLIPPDDGTNIDNFPKGCIRDETNKIRFFYSYRYFDMATVGNWEECSLPRGSGMVDYNNVVKIEYTIWDNNLQEFLSDSFTGKKIN